MTAKSEQPDGLIATVDAKVLATALQTVNQVVDRKNTIPIISCVLIEAGEDDVSLTGTNLDMQAEAVIGGEDAQIDQAGAFCVNAQELQGVIARMMGEVVIAHDTRTRRLRLGTGRGRVELPTLPAQDFTPLMRMDGEVSFNAPPGAIAAGFSAVASSVSTEETRYYLNGVLIERDEGKILFTSTDGHRLTQLPVIIDGEALPEFEPGIVPRQILQAFIKLCEGATGSAVKVSLSENMIEIAAGSITIRSKLIDGPFPDYRRVIPKGPFAAEVPFPVKELKEAVELVVTASSEKSRSVKIAAEEGRLRLVVRGSEGREAEAIVEHVDIPPDVPEIGFNGAYLVQALDKLKAEEGVLRIVDPASPGRVEVDGDSLIQVVMPLRV